MVGVMKVLDEVMKMQDVEEQGGCGSCGMGDGKKGKDIMKGMKKKRGMGIEMIEGEEEGKMIQKKEIEWMEECKGKYMYVDVGGGSREMKLV